MIVGAVSVQGEEWKRKDAVLRATSVPRACPQVAFLQTLPGRTASQAFQDFKWDQHGGLFGNVLLHHKTYGNVFLKTY